MGAGLDRYRFQSPARVTPRGPGGPMTDMSGIVTLFCTPLPLLLWDLLWLGPKIFALVRPWPVQTLTFTHDFSDREI